MSGVGFPGLRDCLLDAIWSDMGVHPSQPVRDRKGKQETRIRECWAVASYTRLLSKVRPDSPEIPPSVTTIIKGEWQISLCVNRYIRYSTLGVMGA